MKLFSILATLAGLAASATAFRVFDNTAYTNTSIGFGTSNINWIPNYVCSPLLAGGSLPSEAVWKATVLQWITYPGYPLVLDCEQLYFNNAATADINLLWLSTLQTWAAQVLPANSIVGWYGLVGNTNTAFYDHYRTLIANHTPTAFFPSAYTFTNSFSTWKSSLATVTATAHAINRSVPIVPYTWPQYHGNYSFLPVDLWQQELTYLASQSASLAGFIIWGGKNHAVCNDACQATAGQQPWLKATRTFLSSLYGLYNGSPMLPGAQVFSGL
ncbi:hypothetical protein HMPREF1624_05856 [Sporothrix schenckii ATCC 58251]|uniref:Uncharacterized protein n=1 Tax=Sporothrix schenckii (strain ATCC 58251 / de Perez 2211183) TaxID=1391915 RepID=U7PT89_SPOS1|nr:hypothetical protein HMPREF1624_05856 [Sporothrix schenckii ATCC 58251]